jgi:hypothetical protein
MPNVIVLKADPPAYRLEEATDSKANPRAMCGKREEAVALLSSAKA